MKSLAADTSLRRVGAGESIRSDGCKATLRRLVSACAGRLCALVAALSNRRATSGQSPGFKLYLFDDWAIIFEERVF